MPRILGGISAESLKKATEADRKAWQEKGTIATHRTVTYHGKEEDQDGRPKPLHHYLIVAKPGTEGESGVASIIPLFQAKAGGVAQEDPPPVLVRTGGAEAALAKAEEYLDGLHPGLKKVVGEKSA